jgi:predicted dehydrogenase
VRIADPSAARRKIAQETFPHVTVGETEDIINDVTLDAVLVATPVYTHYPIVKTALEHGLNVWVEKPMTSTYDQAKELTDIACARDLVLMVDHTFLFSGVVQKMKELIDAKALGDLLYYDSVRINLGIFQHDINVIWDLAPHDLSIMDYLLGDTAQGICAHGCGHFDTGLEDVAYLTVFYDNNLMAHFHLNWLAPVKVRQTMVGGSKKMLVWNDLDQEERLKIYDKGMKVTTTEGLHRVLATPRMGDIWSPLVPNTESLKAAADYFVQCIRTGQKPHNGGEAGMRIVKMLEATDLSLRESSRIVEL